MIIKFNEFLLLEKVDETSDLFQFISNQKDVSTYLHTTSEEYCKEIFEEGFEFDNFMKTTDIVPKGDKIALDYNLMIRKEYGKCTLIIQIPSKFHDYEELSIKKPYENEDGELIYTLPKEFIRGYYNRITFEIVKNPHFNPNYIPNEVYA